MATNRCAVCSAELTEADRVEALPDGTMPRHVDMADCIRVTLGRQFPQLWIEAQRRERAVIDVIVRGGELE
jgi:hypothetical protein